MMEDLSYWNKNAKERPGLDRPSTKYFVNRVFKEINKVIPKFENLKVLDCGCGNGRFLHHLSNSNGFDTCQGFDYSPEMILQAQKSGLTNVRIGNGLNIPFKEDQFDATMGICYIHNLSCELEAIDEMIRTSNKWIVIIEPNPWSALGLYHLLSTTEELHSLKFTKTYIHSCFREYCGRNAQVVHQKKFSYVSPNKIPPWAIKFLNWIPLQSFFGFYTLTIARKWDDTKNFVK